MLDSDTLCRHGEAVISAVVGCVPHRGTTMSKHRKLSRTECFDSRARFWFRIALFAKLFCPFFQRLLETEFDWRTDCAGATEILRFFL